VSLIDGELRFDKKITSHRSGASADRRIYFEIELSGFRPKAATFTGILTRKP
jgi:hypothetical protein